MRTCSTAGNPQLVGDPVDTLTGAVLEKQRDFRLAGHLPLQWWRHYDSSKADKQFALGWGQTHDFDCHLIFDQDGIRYEGPLGNATFFAPLVTDGAQALAQGKRLLRRSLLRYELHEHAQPIREFVFRDPHHPATLIGLRQSDAQIRLEYDHQGRLAHIVDSLGTTIEVATSDEGLIQELFIRLDRQRGRRDLITYQYDRARRLVGGKDGFNSRFTLEYDENNRLLRKIDRLGHAFVFVYDERGRCVRTVGSDGILDNQLRFATPGEMTEVTRGNGGQALYRYQLGRLSSIQDPLGGVTQFVHDKQGVLREEIDPAGNVSKYVYDDAGALIGKIDARGNFVSEPPDLNQIDPLTHRVPHNAAEYEFGRLVDLQEVARSAPELGMSHEFKQPPQTQLERSNLYSESNLGFVVGRQWWPQPENGRKFDITGDLIQQFDRRGQARRWMYDGNGNVTKYVDFDGRQWNYQYQSWNHLVAETNPLGHSIKSEYDSQENLVAFIDAGGTRSEYAYDLNDHLIEVRRHGQLRERYQRDNVGNLIAKYAADGRLLLKQQIGVGNTLVSRELASGDVHQFQYDSQGRYLQANTGRDALTFQYDAYGNRVFEMRNGLGVSHCFHGPRRWAESCWLNKFRTRYYEHAPGVFQLYLPNLSSHRLTVRSDGSVQQRFANGMVENIKYDEQGRCTEKSLVTSNGTWKRTYQWSGEGELTSVHDSRTGQIDCLYDGAHRLRQRTLPSGVVERFEFDAANNLLSHPGLQSVDLREGNRLLSANKERIEYNDRQHISSRQSGHAITKYHYDSLDQLIRVDTPAGPWQAEYDALGRRVRKSFQGQVTEYFWNTDQLAGEVSPTGRLRLYIYSDPLALTPFMFMDFPSVEAEPNEGKCYYIVSNQIGAPVAVYDDRQEVVWQAEVEPFGTYQVSSQSTIDFNLRFPGHYWEQELGLNYNRFRYYDPVLGRYLQSDPLGIGGGSNVYGAPANPLVVVDVRGLSCPYCDENNIENPPENCKGTEVVYVHVDADGRVVYIGITNNPQRRAREHAADGSKTGDEPGSLPGVRMIVVSDPMSHDDARNIESKAIYDRLDASNVDTNQSVEQQCRDAGLNNNNRGRTPERRDSNKGTGLGVGDTKFTDEQYDLTNGGQRI